MELNCAENGGAVIELYDEADGPIDYATTVEIPVPGATNALDTVELEFDSAGHLVSVSLFDYHRLLPSQQAQAEWSRRT